MSSKFVRATRDNVIARIALAGPAGSGKTMTALLLMRGLVGEKGKIALIDTENGSASRFVGIPGIPEFDHCVLNDSYHPQRYIDLIHEAESSGYDGVIGDSISHAWMGEDGALDLVNQAAVASKSSNTYVAWRNVTPIQNKFLRTMINSKIHLIATLRTKVSYEVVSSDSGKMKQLKKIGLAPIQREGVDYEFDLVGMLDIDNNLVIEKERGMPNLHGKVFPKPGVELGEMILKLIRGDLPADKGTQTEVEEQQRQPFSDRKRAMIDRILDLSKQVGEVYNYERLGFYAEDELEELGKALSLKVGGN